MDDKKRKSSRSFELEKGGKHSFDLNKASARKFDLAKDSEEVSLEELKKDLLADGKIDQEEVELLRKAIYADGKIDQEEADFVFEINDAVSGKKNDPVWNPFFVQVISDYLLKDEKSPGIIDEEEGTWLIEKIGADGQVDGVEKQLLNHLQKHAKKMPPAVTALMGDVIGANAATSGKTDFQQLKKELLADGKIDAEEVKKLRDVLYADGKIDQEEADFVFELNDAVSGKKNDPTWNQFFVQVITDYLLKDEKSPGVIDEDEGKWLVEKIGADGKVDGVEKQLLNHLKQNAKKMPSSVIVLLNGGVSPKETEPTQAPTQGKNTSQPKSGKGKMIAAALAGLLVLGGGGYYLSQQGDDEPEQVAVVTTADQHDNTIENAPNEQQNEQEQDVVTTADQLDNTVEDAPNEQQNEQKQEGETPADATAEALADNNAPTNEAPSVPEQKADAPTPASGSNASSSPASQSAQEKATNVRSEQSREATGPSSATGSVEEEALEVIRGKYGNGEERKRNLGDRYKEIQSKVNEMYRNGLVQ